MRLLFHLDFTFSSAEEQKADQKNYLPQPKYIILKVNL